MGITALIDGDIVAYRCAAANEKADVGLAVWQADQLLSRILEDLNADDWKIYLSGDNNFRYGIDPNYKANRRDKPKPRHLEAIREQLVGVHGASICDGHEADDALGIHLYGSAEDQCVVASIDKDLLQLSGQHYNFVRRELVYIDEFTGWYKFYSQCLIGDATDNVPGCPGIGAARCPRVLGESTTAYQLYECVRNAYRIAYTNKDGVTDPAWETNLERNAQLLYVWRKENDKWTPPQPD